MFWDTVREDPQGFAVEALMLAAPFILAGIQRLENEGPWPMVVQGVDFAHDVADYYVARDQ